MATHLKSIQIRYFALFLAFGSFSLSACEPQKQPQAETSAYGNRTFSKASFNEPQEAIYQAERATHLVRMIRSTLSLLLPSDAIALSACSKLDGNTLEWQNCSIGKINYSGTQTKKVTDGNLTIDSSFVISDSSLQSPFTYNLKISNISEVSDSGSEKTLRMNAEAKVYLGSEEVASRIVSAMSVQGLRLYYVPKESNGPRVESRFFDFANLSIEEYVFPTTGAPRQPWSQFLVTSNDHAPLKSAKFLPDTLLRYELRRSGKSVSVRGQIQTNLENLKLESGPERLSSTWTCDAHYCFLF